MSFKHANHLDDCLEKGTTGLAGQTKRHTCIYFVREECAPIGAYESDKSITSWEKRVMAGAMQVNSNKMLSNLFQYHNNVSLFQIKLILCSGLVVKHDLTTLKHQGHL